MTRKRLDFCHRLYAETCLTMGLFRSYMNPLFAQVGLKPLEGCLLAELGHADGRTAGELSQATGIGGTNLPPVWHALEDKGLIDRQKDAIDGRSHRLFLTSQGVETLERLNALVGAGEGVDEEALAKVRERAMDGFAACRELLATPMGCMPEKAGDAQ